MMPMIGFKLTMIQGVRRGSPPVAHTPPGPGGELRAKLGKLTSLFKVWVFELSVQNA